MFKSATEFINEDKAQEEVRAQEKINGITLFDKDIGKYKTVDKLGLEIQKHIILTESLGYENIRLSELAYHIIYNSEKSSNITITKIERYCKRIPFGTLLNMERATKSKQFDYFKIAYPNTKTSSSDSQMLLGVKEIDGSPIYFIIDSW